ncbi:MAG: T9SS type A sorting domain-containing protein [Moheibacter sp.]
MKKIILSVLAIVSFVGTSLAQNQVYKVTDLDMNEYEDNSVHVFNVHGTFADPREDAKLHLVVSNTSSEEIFVTAEVVEITNTDGTLAQFCIGGPSGNCFFPISVGSFYPSQNGGIIAPNANWGMFDYFINLDPNNLAEYKVRFVQTDGVGNELPGTSFFLGYKYDENMGVSDIGSIAIAEIYPTVASGFTNVTLKENAKVQVLSLEGKSVKNLSMNTGSNRIDLSGLSAGVYFVKFVGESGMTTTSKIVVK